MKRWSRALLLLAILVFCVLIVLQKSVQKEPFSDMQLRIGLMGIFKNEEMVLREWIDHYKWQGVDAFLLLDNNSTDNYKGVLKGTEDYVTVVQAKKNAAQKEHYNNFGIPWCKKHNIDILIVCDVDEYFFVRDGTLLRDYLVSKFSGSNPPAEIYAHWTMFGSSGHEKQPHCIRKSFTWKRRALDTNPKSIVRVNAIEEIDLHRHRVKGETICVDEDLQLNHYAIMSKEYFEKIKMTRGAADVAVNVRDWNYFKRYDHKEEQDTLLRDYLQSKKPTRQPDSEDSENS